MRKFRYQSIRRKLLLIIIATAVASLFLVMIGLGFYEFTTYRDRLARQFSGSAELIAANSAPAMAFEDREAARKILATLETLPEILMAVLYTPGGEVFASFLRPERPELLPPPAPGPESIRFTERYLILVTSVEQKETRLGVLFLQADTAPHMREQMVLYGVIILVAGLAISSIAILLQKLLRQMISKPLMQLVQTTERIAAGDLMTRVPGDSNDEIGQLARSFNQMTLELAHSYASLEESRARLAGIIEGTTDFVAALDPDFRFIAFNTAYQEGFAELFGVRIATGMSLREALAQLPEERAIMLEIWGRALAGEEFTIEREFGVGPKEKKQIEMIFSSIRNQENQLIGASHIGRDITERKRAEEALRLSEERLRATFENAGVGIIEVESKEDRLIAVNDRACKLLGYPREELLDRSMHEITAFEDRGCSDRLNARLREGRADRFEYEKRYQRRNGSPVWVRATVSAVRDSQGHHLRSITTFEDISKRKRAEQERKQLIAELTRSNRELEQFAYVASHDLQEPLRMVASYVQLLEKKYRSRLDEKGLQYMAFAVDGALRMQKLIDGLLTYSRISRSAAEFKPVALNNVFAQAIAILTAQIRETGAKVTSDDLPVVSGDETQLIQLFQNLLGNAVKYRKPDLPPLVHISAEQKNQEWIFRVRDNGIGIEPQYFDRIFLIFQRLHSRKHYPGTGIGLALCKRIVERHHGRIWLESRPGAGTTFFFALPA
jgi:PAS domain S-box-containing protein